MSGKVEDLVLPLILLLPLLALIGGIIAGIMKMRERQRRMELLQRERIAAIERGIDPATLPALLGSIRPGDGELDLPLGQGERQRRRAQSFTIAGVLTLALGLGGSLFFSMIEEQGEAWTIGIIPVFIGLALLFCGWLVRRG